MIDLDMFGSAPDEVVLVDEEPSQPVALDDLFGSMPPIKQTTTLLGVTPELFNEIYGGEAPERFTQTDFATAALAYVETLIDRDGYCVLHNWPAWVYHSLPFISSTLLKNYAKRPSTARQPYICGDDANVGSGCHGFSLQGQAGLDEECFILPAECEGKSAKALEARAYHVGQNPGLIPLPHRYGPEKVPIMDVLRGMDESLNDHPKIGPVLRNSQKEVGLIWVDEGSGCTVKARLDIFSDRIIFDLKKCRSVAGFNWQIKDLKYDIQSGHYFNAAKACGLDPIAFGFIPVEAVPPFECGWGYRNPDKLELDCINAKRLIGLVKQSQLTGVWWNFPVPEHIYNLDDLTPDDTAQDY